MTDYQIFNEMGWNSVETERALEELQNCSKLTDINNLFDILFTKSEAERIESLKFLIINELRLNSQSQRINTITQILNIDGSFRALALINVHDCLKSFRSDQQIKILYPNDKKSFLYWMLGNSEFISQLGRASSVVNPQTHFDPMLLSYELANSIINALKSDGPSYLDIDSLVSNLFENVGLVAFNLLIVRDYFSRLSYESYKSKESLISYLSIINEKFLARTTINAKKYWLIYVLIEELLARGYGVRGSFRESEKLLGEKKHTVQRRYYQMKKIVQEKNLTMYDVINTYGLSQALYELIIKLV